MIANVWTERFVLALSDEQLDQAIEVPAIPLNLRAFSVEAGAEILRSRFGQIFTSSPQTRGVIRRLVDIGFAHASSNFVSADAYVRGLYEQNPWQPNPASAVCLTGLAGVGKTAIVRALEKLLGGPFLVDVPGHTDIPLLPGWFLTMKDGAQLIELLKPFVRSFKPEGSPDLEAGSKKLKIPIPTLLKLARRLAWRDAACLLVVDEFQFITAGDGANARATTVLLQLFGLGPRLVFVANFSLVHKLKRRNQEDRDRLLLRPIIVHPERCSSLSWIRLIAECKRVDPEVFAFDVNATEGLLHRFTFGIKRFVVELLVAAFRESRRHGDGGRVDEKAIHRAYCSAEYSACREDVEILRKQQILGGACRQDLWCPFSDLNNTENISEAQHEITGFNNRVSEDYLRSSLTPDEKAGLKQIENDRVDEKPPGKVVRISRKGVTAETLLEGSRLFERLRR